MNYYDGPSYHSQERRVPFDSCTGHQTVAHWHVRPVQTERKAKNMVFFVGDGMAPTMISVRFQGFIRELEDIADEHAHRLHVC